MAGPSVLYQTGDHASRPAVDAGCVLYSCTDHSKVYVSDASAWSDFVTIPTGASVATDTIWDAAGDLAVGSGADTAAKLPIGATNGMALRRVSGAVAWDLPPGHEYDYAEFTSAVTVTGTTEGGADTVVASNSVAYPGSVAVWVEFWSPYIQSDENHNIVLVLLQGATVLGVGGLQTAGDYASASFGRSIPGIRRKVTPSAASHTFTVKAYKSGGTAIVGAGSGGSGQYLPGFIRVTKA